MNQYEKSTINTCVADVSQGGANLRMTALALAVACIWQIPVSQAQPSASGVTGIEEIVVTARRREESMQDIPIAVTAMGEDYLRMHNMTDFESISYQVPSFGVSTVTGSTNLPIVTLRGQRPSEMQINTDAAVPMYFADVVMTPAHGTNLAMYDLENVQVLKGPQGNLFGRNSTGGAVLLTPKRPGDEFGGYVDVDVGNYNLIKVESAVDLPVNEVLKFRLAGRGVDRDGYQDNVADNALRGSNKYWDEDSTSLRLSMALDFDHLRNLTVVSYDKNDMLGRVPIPKVFNPQASLGGLLNAVHNGGAGIGGPSVDNAIERQAQRSGHKIETDLLGRESVRNRFLANTTEYDLSDRLTLKNIFGYRRVEYSAAGDSDGTAVPMFGAVTSLSEEVTRNPPRSPMQAEQLSNELQLMGSSFDDRMDWIAGVYWYEMEASQSTPIQVVGANPNWPSGPAPVPQLETVWRIAQNGMRQNSPAGDVENDSYAVFGEFTYDISDKWGFALGARYTWDDRSITARNFAANSQTGALQCNMFGEDGVRLPNDDCRRQVSKDFTNLTWRTAIDYKPRDGLMFYGSVSTGHRSGGFNIRGTDNFTLMPFDEETVITYEVGLKGDWQLGGGDLRTNLTAYYQDFDDIQRIQALFVDGAFGNAIVNAAEATIKGLEFDATYSPTHNLSLSLAWAYVDIGYDKWDVQRQVGRDPDTGAPIVETQDNSDSVFTWVPEQSLTGSIRYDLPLAPEIGDLSIMASMYWQNRMYTYAEYKQWVGNDWVRFDDIWDTVKVSGYTIWNMRFDWRSIYGSGFDLALYVNNVSDKEYVVGGNNNADSLGLALNVLGAPRTVGAALRWNF